MPYYKKVKTKEKNNLSFSRLLQTPVQSFVHPIWWYHRRNVMSPKLVNNKMIAWIVFEYTPSCFQQKKQGPSAHLKTTHTDNSSMINFSMLTKSQCIVTFWKAAGFPFPWNLNLCDVQNSSYFYHRESWQNLTLSIHFVFFSIDKQKAKMKSATECYRPKIRTNKALGKYHYRKQNKKSFWSCLLFSFGNSMLVYYKHCFIKRREKKLLRRLSATRDSKLNSSKWEFVSSIQKPEILTLNQLWNLEAKDEILWVKANLIHFDDTLNPEISNPQINFFLYEIKVSCSFLPVKTSAESLKVLLPR